MNKSIEHVTEGGPLESAQVSSAVPSASPLPKQLQQESQSSAGRLAGFLSTGRSMSIEPQTAERSYQTAAQRQNRRALEITHVSEEEKGE